jgi:phosphoglycolate phosphatase-like HAD superfamily hydrolase
MEKILLSKYFRNENIVAKDDQLELKPSPRGLLKLKSSLKLKDWEMLYIGDGHDDYLAAKGANVFFAMIAQGLVGDMSTISEMKRDPDFGGAYSKTGRMTVPKFIVAFNYSELLWWLRQLPDFRKRIKAVCFDLGDTLVTGGREEAYDLADRNWPTWEVDRLLEGSTVDKKLKDGIMGIRIEGKWRHLGDFPAMNSSEIRIAAYFILSLFGLRDKDLVAALYSESGKYLREEAKRIAKEAGFALNTSTIPDGSAIKDLATIFPPEQFSLFMAAALSAEAKKDNVKIKPTELAVAIRSAFLWIVQYRKYEVDAYRKHCRVPHGLPEFLDFLTKSGIELCIYTSKTKNIVETAIAFEKEVSSK